MDMQANGTGDRVRCCIIGCRRTRKKTHFREWMCQRHTMMTKERSRKRLRRHQRYIGKLERTTLKMIRVYWQYPPGSPERIRCAALWHLERVLWERMKKEATEATVGIG